MGGGSAIGHSGGRNAPTFTELFTRPGIVSAMRIVGERRDVVGDESWVGHMTMALGFVDSDVALVRGRHKGFAFSIRATQIGAVQLAVVMPMNAEIRKSVARMFRMGATAETGSAPSLAGRVGMEVEWGDVRSGEIALDRGSLEPLNLLVRLHSQGAWVSEDGTAYGMHWRAISDAECLADAGVAASFGKALIVAEGLTNALPETIAAAWRTWKARAA